MAMVFFLLASIGGVAVADLALENPTASEATVFTQPISGSSQGVLLAMAAALGSVVAGLLVAWMSSTSAWPARRTQLRTVSVGTQSQAAAPAREQAGLLEEWFGRHVPRGDLGQPVR